MNDRHAESESHPQSAISNAPSPLRTVSIRVFSLRNHGQGAASDSGGIAGILACHKPGGI